MKKLINITLSLIIFPIIVALGQVKNEVSLSDIESIKQNCDSQSVKYHPNGEIMECLLLNNLTINELVCKGKITFYAGNKLMQFELAQTALINSINIPANSTILLNENGFIKECWFSENVIIGEIEVKGSNEKVITSFYENAKIKSCYLSQNIDIQGIPCSSKGISQVYFYLNGKLKRCTLSRNITLNNVKYLKGTIIEIGLDGKITKISN